MSGVSNVSTSGNPSFSDYVTNNYASGDPAYVGRMTSLGKWSVLRFGTSSTILDYANVSNNPTVTDYATAWAGRVTLTYSAFNVLTGV